MHTGVGPTGSDPARPGGPLDSGLLEAVFASMGAGVCVVDAEGVVSACNPAAEQMLGHRPGGLLGREVHQALCFRGPDGQVESAVGCPLLEAARTGQAAAGDTDDFVRADGTTVPVAWTSTPLRRAGRVIGVVVVFRDATARQRAQAQWAAQDAHGRQARRQAEAAHATLIWLAEVADALGSTLDAYQGLRQLTRLLVPRLADWAALDVTTGRGRAQRLAWPGGEDTPIPGAAEAGPLPRFAPASSAPLARVLDGAGTRLLTDVAAAGPGCDALDETQRKLFAGLGAACALLVPLRLRGVTLGAMTLIRTDPANPFSDDEVVLAEEVARRAALSLDNARLYGQQADIAAVLQRSLLTDLPHVEGLELAAAYRPAQRGAEIGGDWYDAFLLPDGDLAVVVGDVVGHDLQAASRMGALRNMLRALAVDRTRTPGQILQRLDAAMTHLDVADSATAVYGCLRPADRGRWHFTWSNAGHPPPLLLSPDGESAWLEDGHTLLLGVEPDQPRPTATTVLPPGTTVLLYTDGLIESHSHSIETGLARLRHHATVHADQSVDKLCTELIEALGDPADDITVIAVRTPAQQAVA